jgi:hypothetical protein
VVHIHKDGTRHIHHEKKIKEAGHHHKDKNHSESTSEDKNCCSGPTTAFQQLDKSIPFGVHITHPIFVTTCPPMFYKVELFSLTDITKDIKQFVRSYHPPISDIRIAIQSFQI